MTVVTGQMTTTYATYITYVYLTKVYTPSFSTTDGFLFTVTNAHELYIYKEKGLCVIYGNFHVCVHVVHEGQRIMSGILLYSSPPYFFIFYLDDPCHGA